MTDFETEFAQFCEAYGTPERIELLLCDLNAILRGKWLPGDQAAKLTAGQVRLPISTYAPTIMGTEPPETGLGIVAGDPDGVIVPVPGSLTPVPWAEGRVAQVLVEMDGPDAKDDLSSRRLLGTVLEGFSAQGLKPVIATELEFYITRPRKRSGDAPKPPNRLPDAQNYELDVLDGFAPILTEIQSASKAQGLATDTLIAEFGPGQFEINFHHTDDVLNAADTALLFRRLVRGVVAKHGYEATFMAKPYAREPGNGMHVHVSVQDAKSGNIFDGKTGPSDRLLAAVAGVLATMSDMQAVFAPHMNSYRRFQPNSFAPSRPDWGHDHRGAAVRLPQSTGKAARLEHRISGADVNPYLAVAAILGGILHGLENDLPLPLPLDDPQAEEATPLGHDWLSAVERFAGSGFAQKLFGKRYRDIYVAVKRDEIAALTPEISPVEYRYYLGRI
ncbi:MAG TPA: glutamine synthetase [Rhodobacteraceae bacterium]|nr:glutamine synthetase [Paracoccaceae bacterium]